MDSLPEEEYEEVEYLEEFEVKEDNAEEINSCPDPDPGPLGIEGLDSEAPLGPPKRKWPKKKKKHEIKRAYKQYCYQDLEMAVKDVIAKTKTVAEAAEVYRVPRKTLVHKVDTFVDTGDILKGKHLKLIHEVKTLLNYTSAMPFKTKTSRYHCFYCSTDGPFFEDVDELKYHSKTEHKEEWDRIEIYTRPKFLNEIIKLDVEDLHCKMCKIFFDEWNNLFVHLAESHYLEFDLAYTNAIPYALADQLKCFLCREGFSNFGTLDAHMNSHYSNYMCDKCGDTFLTSSRLDKHLEVHKIGAFPCDFCEKVFSLQKYKTKHISLVHRQDNKDKCLYCPEAFVGPLQRHTHVMEKHKDKLKYMICELCGKSFTWKPYFVAHMRRRHTGKKNQECKVCNKLFLTNYELKVHMVRHSEDKSCVCAWCGEKFFRVTTLKNHVKLCHPEKHEFEN